MIEGITILNQTEIMAIPKEAFLIAAFICVFLGIAVALATKIPSMFFGIGIITFFISLPILSCFEEPTGRYKYECTIDKSVSMTEVHEKYEVVEQRGDIWVLRDKE